MTVSGKLGDETLERLRVLLERHAVGISTPGTFCGTGFLVTPDTVLTCAHVVAGRRELTVLVQGRTLPAEIVRMTPERSEGRVFGYPDLAELRLADDVECGHRLDGVWLDRQAPHQATAVSVHGFSGRTLEPECAPTP
jgi:hypothetical protein